jgi:hypothetical protein
MFLAHLTSDEFVIEQLLEAASQLYANKAEATLETVPAKQKTSDLTLVYTERPIEEARLERADRSDDLEKAGDGPSDRDSEKPKRTEGMRVFASAVQTLRIVGQVLRNFPGTLNLEAKAALTEAACGLGLRSLAAANESLDDGQQQALQLMMRQLREAYPNLPEDRIKSRAKRFLWFATILTTFGLIRLTSSSIAAPELDPAYEKVFSSDDSIARRLINASLKIDVSNGFPVGFVKRLSDSVKEKALPTNVLKLLALEHFEQVWVQPADRQAVCAKLGIEYRFLPLGPRKE